MRTDPSPSAGKLGARVRAQLQRAGRTWRQQAPGLRLAVGAAALALLGAAVYLAVPSASGTALVKGGQSFAPDDLLKIEPELQRKRIVYRIDDGRRIAVPADSLAEANEVVQKVGAGLRALEDILKEGQEGGGIFDPPEVREQRKLASRGAFLAELIRRLPDTGIVAAHVKIQARRTREGLRTITEPTAFVLLETEHNRAVRFQVVKKIEDIIVNFERDIPPDAISIFDQGGHHYVDALKPEVREQTHLHAREEELTEKILEQIDHIKGVQVTVQMVPVAPSKPEPSAPAKPDSEPEPAASPRAASLLPPPIAVNQPAEIVPDPKPEPEPEPESKPAPPPAPPASKPEPPAAPSLLARVWVKVPRSWYRRAHMSERPSEEELRQSRAETERQIQTAVAHVIPPAEVGGVKVDTIPDDLPARHAPAVAVVPGGRETQWVWLLVGVLAGVAVMLVPLGLHLASGRRPAPRAARPAELGWFQVDAPDEAGPGPSERVRELIRLNPEAAASVLHRWTGQGGPVE